MATKITVNGTTITVQNKSAAVEAFDMSDEFEACARAAEAYAISEMACKTYDNFAAKMSSEAAPGFVSKVGAGLKKVWEAIKNFFIRIGKFIKTWIQSKTLKIRAASVYKKIKENGIKNDWRKVSVANCPSIKEGLAVIKANASASKRLMQTVSKIAGGSADDVSEYTEMCKKMEQFGSTKTEKSTVGNLVMNPDNEIVTPLAAIAMFNGEIISFLKIADSCADKMCKVAQKFAEESKSDSYLADKAGADKKDLNKLAKMARVVQQYCNKSVSSYIAIANAIVKIGGLIASDGANGAKDFVKTVQKNKPDAITRTPGTKNA